VVTEKGQIKRMKLAEFPAQGRGGQGVQTWKIVPTTGLVVGFTVVDGKGDVDLFSPRFKRLRLAVKDIPEATRAAKGTVLKTWLKLETLFGDEPVGGVTSV
jgi:DNA gyrase subunit A